MSGTTEARGHLIAGERLQHAEPRRRRIAVGRVQGSAWGREMGKDALEL